ncbi:MAG: glutamate racemase [Actinobacteria bacterium]|nr:MAG: glutamate racemase [Actinomycetota bacterium]
MKNKPIGIFDSGVGGLTVAAQIMEKLPNENIIYFGDTARFPYGTKSATELIEYTFQIVKFLREQDVKLAVIACNSASSAALEKAQEHFEIPILGVVEPGARAAVLASINRHIGAIGTETTIKSDAYKKAIHMFDAGAQVFSATCPSFASFVENGHIEGDYIYEMAEKYLTPLKKQEVDSLILGCTHYPLLSDIIQKVMGTEVKLINSAEETALEVREVLERKDQLRKDGKSSYRFISTGDSSKFHKLGTRFLGREIKQVETVKLDVEH